MVAITSGPGKRDGKEDLAESISIHVEPKGDQRATIAEVLAEAIRHSGADQFLRLHWVRLETLGLASCDASGTPLPDHRLIAALHSVVVMDMPVSNLMDVPFDSVVRLALP